MASHYSLHHKAHFHPKPQLHTNFPRRHPIESLNPLPLKSTTTTTSITTTTQPYTLLQHHLSTRNFRQADEETRRLLIALAGEPAVKRGYVFFSEVRFIPEPDLRAIDGLWREHSGDRFGYSVQRRIWMNRAGRDFTKFFIRVGWMKKLDTEVEQYNYRAFPDEFMWELNDETPEGHLPLTNALRGTQLLSCVLTHPAFQDSIDEEEEEDKEVFGGLNLNNNSKQSVVNKKVFNTNYSF